VRGAPVADLIPVLAWQPDEMLFFGADQTLGFGFVCRPLAGGDDKTEARLKTLLQEDWPDNTLLQISLLASPNLVQPLRRVAALRAECDDRLLAAAVAARRDFLAAAADAPFAFGGGLLLRDFRLIVAVKVPCGNTVPERGMLERIGELRRRAEGTLRNAGLRPQPMDADALVAELGVYFNRGLLASWRRFGGDRARDDRLLCAQVVDAATDLRIERDGLWLDDVRLTLLSAKTLPETLGFGMAAYLVGDMLSGVRGLRAPFFITANLFFPDAQALRMKLATKRNWTVNAATGPIARWMPALAQRARDLDALGASVDKGHRPLRLSLTLGLYSASPALARPREQRAAEARERSYADIANALTFWSESGLGLMQDRFICLPLFINAVPFCADVRAITDLGRYRTMTTEHAVRLVPVFADWTGTGTPALSLISRNGQLMDVCLFDSSTNYNLIIAAESGSGKSFLANELIVSYLSKGAAVWVIDVGRSYEKLCHVMDGQYIDFGEDGAIGLNPFPLVSDYDEEADILEAVVAAMAAPTEMLSDLQRAELSRVMRDLWTERGRSMTIDDIAGRLRESADERVRDIGVRLYAFTSAGAYGRYFHGPNTVAFRRRFTVLELENLRSRRALQRVVLLMLIYAIQQQMYRGSRGHEKLVLIDEAWDLLTDGEVGKFIETGYRRFRKYRGAAITITQSMADFHASETGRAVAANSANMMLLGQKADVIDALRARRQLALSDPAAEVLKTVHTVPGQYSEIFVATDRGQGVGRLIVAPFARLLYSTRPDDVAAIDRHRAQGLSVRDAIAAVLAGEAGAPGSDGTRGGAAASLPPAAA
jgi:conjugal transfer ATP-binding protein TraC